MPARTTTTARRARGGVVSLSGIDGSGKSTQAAALAEALRDAGVDAVVEWSRITYDPALRAIAAPVKRALGWVASRRAGLLRPETMPQRSPWDPPATEADVAARGLRDRLPAVDAGWILVVAVVHALGPRRTLRPHLRAGRSVVRDRYVLDATVQLEDVYGDGRAAGLPGRVLRRLCPSPVVAFWLDADPEAAYARKPEEYTSAQLARHRAHYAAVHERLGAVRVDADRDPAAVTADIVRETRRRLP